MQDINELKRAEDALRESEEKFRGLTEGSAHGILAINLATMRFAYANPTACRMFGYSTQEMLEMDIVDVHPKDSLPHVLSEFRAKMAGGGLAADLPCLRKDGTVLYADVSGTMLSLQSQKCAVGFFVDVTERKRAEEALAESEEKYRMLVEQTTDVIFTVDKDGRYRYVNTVFASTFGKTPEYFIGKTFWDIYPKEEADQRFETVSRTFQTGDIGTAVVRVPLADKTLWYLATSNPVKDSAGNIVEVLVYAKDITERKRAEDELQKLSLAVRYSNELVNLATPDGQMIFLNEAGGKILGIPPAEVCHTHIMQVIPAHLKERVEKEMLPTMMGGGTWSGDLQYTNLETGQLIDVFATTFAIKDQKTGKLLYFANVSIDITERKRAEEALRES